MSTIAEQDVWISKSDAARRIGVDVRVIAKMIEAGCLTVRELPGTRPRVLLADVERVAANSIRPASPAEVSP
jgi:hypothetical protein